MNYMEKVADMLGVEINEEFKIEGYGNNLKFKFTENRFLQSYDYVYEWVDSISIMNVLEGRAKIIKIPKSILTEKEKEYLSYVIKPFRDSITYFYKRRYENDELEWIKIEMKNDDVMYFPKFKKGTMYKKMELNKKYTLEDLDL